MRDPYLIPHDEKEQRVRDLRERFHQAHPLPSRRKRRKDSQAAGRVAAIALALALGTALAFLILAILSELA